MNLEQEDYFFKGYKHIDIDDFNDITNNIKKINNNIKTHGTFANTSFHEDRGELKEKLDPSACVGHITNESDFEYFIDNSDLIEYLMLKKYDVKYFKYKNNNQLFIDKKIMNIIFYTCYQKFKHQLDALEVFSTLTDFYNFEPKFVYKMLLYDLRKMLFDAYKIRTGETIKIKNRRNVY